MPSTSLAALECIKCFVGIPNERKTHFRLLLFRHSACDGTVSRRCVFLWDFINREIGDIDIRGEAGFERSTDSAKLFPDNSTEERMVLDLISAAMSTTLLANTVFRIAKETIQTVNMRFRLRWRNSYLRIRCSES